MSKELVRVVVSLGMVDQAQLQEFVQWGLVDRRLVLTKLGTDLEGSEAQLNMALDVVGIERKETDLEVPKEYEKTLKVGRLRVFMDGGMRPALAIYYGRTRSGDYIFVWNSEGFEEVLVNGRTYLETETHRVYFMGTRPVYCDDRQSFVVCKSSSEEARDGDDG